MNRDSHAGAEFVALVALLTAIVALSTDMMLPALGTIATELGASDPNQRQYALFFLFAGLTGGQLVYGPLSDAIGRRPAILAGLAIFVMGTVGCIVANDYPTMLAARVVQGFGAAGPRIVSTAMIRDRQSGAAMARTMSLVMTVFIVVPIVAPSLGQLVLAFAGWRWIFGMLLAFALAGTLWFAMRQPETLPRERRRAFGVATLAQGARAVIGSPVTAGYTVATGLIFSSMVAYLGVSQQIFVEQYGQGRLFGAWFALFAAGLGSASLVNARLVMRWGMRRLTRLAQRGYLALSLAFVAVCIATGGQPPFWSFVAYMLPAFFCKGILFGNFNAMAMEPMGRMAGIAASIIGTVTSLISLAAGAAVGQRYDGTLTPLIAGFALFGFGVVVSSELAERSRERLDGAQLNERRR